MLYNNIDIASGNGRPKYANTSSVLGVSATEVANTSGDGRKVAHAGWNQLTLGTGPVQSIAVTTAGTGYANGEYVTFTGAATTNANASITVSNGTVVSVTVLNPGAGYSATPTVTIASANGANAVLAVTMGGRAGRRQYETLVAMGSITNDNAGDNTYFPGV